MDISAKEIRALEAAVGGEIKSYTDMLNEAREIAVVRLMEEATSMKAASSLLVNVMF